MLNIPELDDLGFERIFERARAGIAALSEEWTDQNYHDPGITMLHTFAWLADMQNYYIDATGDKHRMKYLKLLGLLPSPAPARCVLGIDAPQAEISVPRGTRVAAGSIVFETCSDYRARRNRLIRLIAGTDGALADLTAQAGHDGNWARVFAPASGAQPVVYFGFERELEEETRFYVDVWGGYRRNAFGEGFALTQLTWECYAGGAWYPVDVLEDGTCGLLCSGFLSLLLPEPTEPLETDDLPRAHYLRCRLVGGEYDVQPRIGTVTVNCVRAEQVSTRARLLSCVSGGGEYLDIDCTVRENDLVTVALREGDGYSVCALRAPDEGGRCMVERSAMPGRAAVHFFSPPVTGQELLVSVMDRDFWGSAFLGRTDGCAGQRMDFRLVPDGEHLLELRLALAEPDDPGRFTLWDLCEDVALASYDERAFSYDAALGQIVFGDSLHGLEPDAGLEVRVVHMRTSRLDGGNALRGRVSQVLDPIRPRETGMRNLNDAHGGQAAASPQELARRLEEHLFTPRRAVTPDDYHTLVMRTPGLAIDLVNIVPMAEYVRAVHIPARPNTVVAVVKPYSDDNPRPVLSGSYRRIIRENLEQYRLLTTDILVESVRYAGVNVYGRIELDEHAYGAGRAVEALLCERIDFTHTRAFGARVAHAHIFSALERIEGVRSVRQLSFEVQGTGAQRGESGDVSASPDCLLVLGEVRIEYVSAW